MKKEAALGALLRLGLGAGAVAGLAYGGKGMLDSFLRESKFSGRSGDDSKRDYTAAPGRVFKTEQEALDAVNSFRNKQPADQAYKEFKTSKPYMVFASDWIGQKFLDSKRTYENVFGGDKNMQRDAESQMGAARWLAATPGQRANPSLPYAAVGASRTLPVAINTPESRAPEVANNQGYHDLSSTWGDLAARDRRDYSKRFVPINTISDKERRDFAASAFYDPHVDAIKMHHAPMAWIDGRLREAKGRNGATHITLGPLSNMDWQGDILEMAMHEGLHALEPWRITADYGPTWNGKHTIGSVPYSKRKLLADSDKYYADRGMPIIGDIHGYEKNLPEFIRGLLAMQLDSTATYNHRIQGKDDAMHYMGISGLFGPDWEEKRKQIEPNAAGMMDKLKQTAINRIMADKVEKKYELAKTYPELLKMSPEELNKWVERQATLGHDYGWLVEPPSQVDIELEVLSDLDWFDKMYLWQQVRNNNTPAAERMSKTASVKRCLKLAKYI